MAEIRESFDATSSSIIPRIRELEKNNLINKGDGKYCLTPIGMVLANKLLEAERLSQLAHDCGKFLKDHDLTPIPEHLLNRIDELGECNVIENNAENLAAAYWGFVDNLPGSNTVMGISSIFDLHLTAVFISMAKRGTPISTIIADNIFKKMEKDHADILKVYLDHDNVRLYVIDDARLAFVVTDKFTSISLYNKNGSYDTQTILISFEKSALKWGRELFEYYMKRSKEVTSP